MGRKKLQIKLIQNKDSRSSTFSKRRSGLIKKAQELSVLCEVDVALLVFSSAGNPYHFSSAGHSLDKLLERYQHYLQGASDTAVAENEKMDQSEDAWSPYAELLQGQVENHEVEQLSISDLSTLEEQLRTTLAQVRSKKLWVLKEENKQLKEQMNLLLLNGNHGNNPKDDDAAVDLNAICQEDDDAENSMNRIDKATLPLLK